MTAWGRTAEPGEARTMDRRGFLRSAALATAGVAGAAAVPAPLQAVPAAAAARMEWRKAPCTLCNVGCGLLVGIRDGRAVAVKGDPGSPVSRGLACAKGYHAVQTLYGGDRITSARIRSGGRLVTASLDDALGLVATRLHAALTVHGADGVGMYGSARCTVAERYVAARLFRGVLGTHNIASETDLDDASGAAGLLGSFGMHGMPGCYDDIEHADVVVLWNHNLAECDPVLFSRLLERRRTAPGMRIVELTTRLTRTSYAADRSLPYAPHTELALANALCHEIVRRGWSNRRFVEQCVAFRAGGVPPADGDELQPERVTATDWDGWVRFLDAYEPDAMAAVVGVAAPDLRWLASLYGDPARRVVSIWGADVNRHVHGTWLNNALYNIHLLVGKIATPGNGALCTTAVSDPCGVVECAGPLQPASTTAHPAHPLQRQLAARIWDVDVEHVDARTGPGALPLFAALERGTVRFLWIAAADPLRRLPNLTRYRTAVGGADRFLVVSDAYPTATTDAADVVLPTTLWIERAGVAANAERRLQHFEQMVDAPGDARDCAWQMIEVARRLGHGDAFAWPAAGYVDAAWHGNERFHAAASRRLPPLATLRARAGAHWPFVEQETKWRYNTTLDPAADPRRGAFDFYGHADHRAWIWLRPHQPPPEAPSAAFPLWLMTGSVLEHDTSGATRRVPVLHRAMPRAYVELNADDAASLGLRAGERVRIVGRRGALEAEARVDERTQPARGTVFVPEFDEALPVNVLTLDTACSVSGQPNYAACVRIERVATGGAA